VTLDPVVSEHQGRVEAASGVLSATGAIGRGTLPFTGFPIWIIVVIALLLITVGLALRRKSRPTTA
jgi:type III secretory pathway component EscV